MHIAKTLKANSKEKYKMTMKRKLNKNDGLYGWKTEYQAVTKAIFNKGFSGNSNILLRKNFVSVDRKAARNS